MDRKFGALPPDEKRWQIGKTMTSIHFVQDAEEFLKTCQDAEKRKLINEAILKIKGGELKFNHLITAQEYLEPKTFFDPHPGFAGAIIPIPAAVKKVADGLNGKTMLLQKAVDMIQAVTNGTVSSLDKWIKLELNENGRRHIFRIICFK